jgi:polyketide synthase PksN
MINEETFNLEMTHSDALRELTESYLKTLISEVCKSFDTAVDPTTPFGELGIDSFHVLKIIKKLEGDFGRLPKTLLFENFNINDLAHYFVRKHSEVLSVKFAKNLQSAHAPAQAAARKLQPVEVVREKTPSPARARQATPILITEKAAYTQPELAAVVRDLFVRYKNDGSVSRGARNIAPNLFIGSERRGYFHYSRSKNIILAYAYTGPEDYFPVLARELYQHCSAKELQLNIFADRVLEPVDGVAFSATPFGVLQRILNLREFTLEGGAMRRLRYQVSKFEKAGECRTEEYVCGGNPEVAASIAGIIDKWCSEKTMVNPLIHTVKAEILAGTLDPQHRIFLTYVDDVLQNAILISPLSEADNGYLMDLEFYGRDMPLGGLEFAIVKIIEKLVAEGRDLFSMGGTYGIRLESSPNADPEVDKILDDLHTQGIFNDSGNLQFKNKFRPENRTIYLCRPVGAGDADNVIDIIMMIADPEKMQTPDDENHTALSAPDEPAPADAHADSALLIEGSARAATLADFGFNPLNIPHEHIDIDLKSDSWAQIKLPAIDTQMRQLHTQLQQGVNVEESLRGVFPFAHFVLSRSGRVAEQIFYKAWPKKGVVLQNLLFPTGLFQQIDNGFTPRELPCPELFDLNSQDPYKSDLAWDLLQAEVRKDPGAIAFVCIEVSSNAAGGHAVSAQRLKKIKALLTKHAIPLVIDGTRVVENARFWIERDPAYAGKNVWAVLQEIFACADVVICSLAKDFCIDRGGVIATNDRQLFRRLEQVANEDGAGLDVLDKKLVALALQDRSRIEAQVARRVEAVRSISQALKARGIPVAQPAGGHCVLIDVKQIPELKDFRYPVASFLAWLYLNTGIRAGAHSVGMQRRTAINDLVRLAIPVGLKRAQIEAIIESLTGLFADKANIPEVVLEGSATESLGDVHSKYKLQRYHNVRAQAAASAAPATAVAVLETHAPVATPAASNNTPAPAPSVREEKTGATERTQDIAIIGMAGRYPKAKNLEALWENLRQGLDCIEDIPADRYAARREYEPIDIYRGGFIDDVDRFDSMFFNIAPRLAEVLDPQERLFLEVAWETLEDAGYYPDTLAQEGAPRDIGVYVGAVWAMYQMVGVEERRASAKVTTNSFLWSIANRVSYFMDLSGPSLTVDTACSSSLTALYLACEAMHRGECSAAIVGGVNLDLHQSKLDINLVGGALSKDGVCRSFGKGANGYVAGEGIGAIFVKPLDRAVQDGDNVYGVIKGIAINHGGRTSGYTVPNPKAQASLILSALEKANVDARSIGYIEAHGTGTELGDPIEVSGLASAFAGYKVPNQTCAIGSIKTNIGHLEAAAGVVGVCKVLLQMKHRQLVPSLHSAELNEFIDFANSPLFVVQQLQEWRPKEVDGVRFPLRAGISSFGAGGANAHIILEAYEPAAEAGAEDASGLKDHIFPLSARNEEQLREAAARLRSCIKQQRPQDIAYTLQVGRKPFEHRLAVVAQTRDELVELLGRFLDGKKDERILVGNVKNAEGIAGYLSRREQEEFVNLLARSRDAQKLAKLWIDGLIADWRGFNPQGSGKRISLPTYPFADRRHWARNSAQPARHAMQSLVGMHPLIDTNESTFERQLFKKTFHDRDFFIYDHHVADIPTLPGVAYLELARKAGEIAAGRKVRRIRNVLYLSPIAVQSSQPKEVLVELKPNGDAVQFEVFSHNESGAKVLHSQGKLHYTAAQEAAAEPETIDLASIRARCAKVIEGQEAYPLFKSLGLNLGPSFQVLKEVYKNDTETLGVLHLPESRQADLQNLLLHPSLVDGSLQAGVSAQLGARTGEMLVPFSIGEVEILHPLQPNCFSYVTEAKDDKKESSKVSRSNVLIVDEQGKVLVRIRESTGVPLRDVHKKPASGDDAEGFEKLYYSFEWEKSPLAGLDSPASLLLFDTDAALRDLLQARTQVVLVQPAERFADTGAQGYRVNPQNPQDFVQLIEALQQKKFPLDKICFAWSADENSVYSFLYLCQALIKQKVEGKIQLLYLFAGDNREMQPLNEAIHGFARSLGLEQPKFFAKTLQIERQALAADTVLKEFQPDAQDALAVRYESQERHVRKLRALDLEASAPEKLREQGVYLITGGAGGLGLIFAEFLAKECKARLVLTGRSKLSAAQEARLDALRKLGVSVLYVPADVANYEAVQNLVAESKRHFGQINGIIHCAGVLRDSYIRNKTAADMAAVLAPKVHGARHLDAATQAESLDFFVLFSSLAAVGGNAGQCDYSFANHFMDSFAIQREQLRAQGARAGRTLSLDWSLWADGGMRLDEQTELMFRKTAGIKPLSTSTGLDAFVRGLASGRAQIAVLEGLRDKVELAWGLRKKDPPPPAPAVSAEPAQQGADTDLVALVENELAQIAMEFLKLAPEDISPDKILLDLGFDSIGLTTYANSINDKYQCEITPVLFFDYPSIREIAKYLGTERRADVLRFHRVAADSPAAPGSRTAAQPPASAPEMSFELKKGWDPRSLETGMAPVPAGGNISPELRFAHKPIAIVGMSGVMPQSADLEEFWDNLKNARNLITVIPEERWSWEEFYGDPQKEANKSNSKWGGFMKDVDKFDPLFFGISPREAQMMDPQQRIFLQTVWKAVEDSGQKVSDLSGTRTGLFVGVAVNDYVDLMNIRHIPLDGYTASGNSHSVLANRISFLLNLRGPSAPLDTACSSSLVALHRAIESIHTGSCDMAIVGGVQVMLTPAAYISFGMAGMLSNDGKCKSFDKRADGYVRGEGAGAIFIKPLAMAEADGNHIYAIVKATAENHGGRVTTLTAPNSVAQSELLIEAYEKAQLDPTTVGFIECHGTGTSLGDPIEIQALTKAFAELYKRRQKSAPRTPHCGLSSVKTNIGHLETAAGIAGILKVLLAIRHRHIPANLHFEELNPYINLKDTPFYIAAQTTPWEAPRSADGTVLPRRAGVSSFGFGGANAHIVLEEYIPRDAEHASRDQGPQLVVLSAKNEDRLNAYAQSMLTHLEKYDVDLVDFAYTLQVGRDEMPERLALVATSTADLKEKLNAFLQDKQLPQDGFHANARERKGKAQPKADVPVQTLLEQKQLAKLAELWVGGAEINWRQLHQSGRPRRLPLPTYPFAKERYWLSDGAAEVTTASLHPLIHRNASTLKEQKFAARFSGKEFFFADHVVDTQKILPGVAYMEMARVTGELSGEARVQVIRQLLWERPLVVGNEAKDVEVALTPVNGEVRFAVKSLGKEHSIVHCSGKLAYAESVADPEVLDIEAIRQRCSEQVLTGAELYPFLIDSGLKLGKSFQIVQSIYATRTEALSILKLPEHLKKDAGAFWLHPALMDGSLHTAIGLTKQNQMELALSIPYSVGEVQIFHPLTELHYGYATWDLANTQKVSYQLLDKDGKVLVRIKDLVSKPFYRGAGKPMPVASPSSVSTTYYRSVWQDSALAAQKQPPRSPGRVLIFDRDAHVRDALEKRGSAQADLVLVKPGAAFREAGHGVYEINPAAQADYRLLFDALLQRDWIPENILHGWSAADVADDREALNQSLNQGVFSLFHISQLLMHMLKERKQGKVKLFYLYPGDRQPQHAAMGGFLKSLALESSKLICKSLEHDALAPAALVDCVLRELQDPAASGTELRYRGGQRSIKTLQPVDLVASKNVTVRENGVYLITGGLGGLGLIFSKFLASQARVCLVLTGRSALGAEQQTRIRELESSGSQVMYAQADLSKAADVERLITEVKARFKRIDGVIHSAGVIRDAFLLKKSSADLEAVFAAKIHGTVNLDQATQAEQLDFFVLFSSLTALTGNPGQTDYAYANSFMDCFAQRRAQLVTERKRSGKTLSLNWPLWREGGMRVDKQIETLLEESKGLKVLETMAGLEAFETALANEPRQVLVARGNSQKIRRMLGLVEPSVSEPSSTEPAHSGGRMEQEAAAGTGTARDEELLTLLKKDLLRIVAKVLMIDASRISQDIDMSEYGFDSIGLTKLFSELNERFRLDLTPAIFFEYPTFNALSEFLFAEHREQVEQCFQEELKKVRGPVRTTRADAEIPKPRPEKEQSVLQSRFAGAFGTALVADIPAARRGAAADLSIAVVGMSGVFPQSADLEEFWNNIAAEKDLITEIPPDRWDWTVYQGNPLEERNRTNSRWGGFMKEVDKFDPLFFGISPVEAELMDPQQRMFMETVWRTIEDAGHKPSDLAGTRTGVFVGVAGFDYLELLRDSKVDVVAYTATGMSHCVLPNRISYLLDLHGPSEPVDTACSSSLVAMHRAVEAMANGTCEMAITGGVNALLTPSLYLAFGNAGMLSNDGRCKTFDKRADGYVRGEGCAAVLLKTLDRAIADGNPIYGLVKSTGVNHGGRATSLTAPNPNAQADLLIDVYHKAGIDPNSVSYIEAHGTGTALGDPVEINGLKKAFKELNKRRNQTPRKGSFIGVGSVKTNIGHLEMAAGIAGVVKVLLSIQHRKIPANIHYGELNPHIRLEGSPFYVVQKTQDWAALTDDAGNELPRTAGVSSFGFGGANAHVVLQEYRGAATARETAEADPSSELAIPLSARTAEQLHQKAVDLLAHIRKQQLTSGDLVSLAYTLQVGREAMDERLGLVVSSIDELQDKLQAFIDGRPAGEGAYRGQVKQLKEQLGILNQDADIRETIVEKWIARRKLAGLVEFWVKGLDLDWSRLYGDVQPRRLRLPSYPFAKQRHWINTTPAQHAAVPRAQSVRASYDAGLVAQLSTVESCVAYLRSDLASILGIGPSDIDSDRTLGQFGVDSIASVRLVRNIQAILPAYSFPRELVAKDLTLEQLARHVVEFQQNAAPSSAAAIVHDERAVECLRAAENARVRVLMFFCFGFGRDSLKWVRQLPPDIEVWGVGATDISRWDELVPTLAERVKHLFDKPVVVWGHSMGSAVAFEVLAYLESRHGLEPRVSIHSACTPPALFERTKYNSPFYGLADNTSDTDIENELLAHHLIVPRGWGVPLLSPDAIRNDVALLKTYQYETGKRLRSPLCIVYANNDVMMADPSLVAHWESMTQGACRYEQVEGTHLFHLSPPQGFLQMLLDCCAGVETGVSEGPSGTYQLKQMYMGTHDVHLYPLSTNARGRIIFTPDGYVAAHLWHPSRPASMECDSPVELFTTYIAYSGDYSYRPGILDHGVEVALLPDMEGKTLKRYVERQGSDLYLATSPVVMSDGRQEDFAAYQKLTWGPCADEPGVRVADLTGTWRLVEITASPAELSGSEFKGMCIVTEDGYISVMMSDRNRPSFAYRNPALASRAEIDATLSSCVSWLGRLSTATDLSCSVETLVWQAPFAVELEHFSYRRTGNRLVLSWPAQPGAEVEHLMETVWELLRDGT